MNVEAAKRASDAAEFVPRVIRARATKVIHVVERMGRGAVESWLLRVLRVARENKIPFDWTFYCTVGPNSHFDQEAAALGAKVIYSPVEVREKLAFVRTLRATLRQGGYAVLDCHDDLMSAVSLVSALGLPISKRFVHVHNAANWLPTPWPRKRAILTSLFRRICMTFADRIIGVSNVALDAFICGAERRKNIDIVQFCGIDSRPFECAATDRSTFRRNLGLAADAKIILFAGRLVAEKDPLFALDVMVEMQGRDPMVAGLFVGTGDLEDQVRKRVSELKLENKVLCLGWRDDLADIMRCCDWYVHSGPEQPPEGFGFTVVEAQLAGLRVLLSQGVTDDALLRNARFRRLSVSAGPGAWADAAFELWQENQPDRELILAEFRGSPLDLRTAVPQLFALYDA